MKIIAQSLVVSKMPYLHLGYTAATSFRSKGEFMTGGIVLLLVGVLLAIKIRWGKNKRFITEKCG
jgi:hypothetical protein